MHYSGFGAFMRHDETQVPEIDRALLKRVLSYAKPYRGYLLVVLVTIVVITLLSLLPPLLMRTLIDTAIPEEDLRLVTILGLAMVAVPLVNGIVGVVSNGLFAHRPADRLLLGTGDGVKEFSRPTSSLDS